MLGSQVYDVAQNIYDAMTGQTNDQGEPITIGQQTVDALMNGAISLAGGWGQAGGKIIGEAASALAKPVTSALGKMAPYASQAIESAASILGGGTGVASGTLASDSSLGLGKLWGLIDPAQRTPDLLQGMKDAWANGGLDMIVNGALHLPMAGKPLVRTAVNKLFQITPQMITDAEVAHKFGIPITMNNLADKSTLAKLIRTVTSVIPIVGHPYLDLQDRQIEAINKYSQDLPGRIADPSTAGLPTVVQTGTTIGDIANRAFTQVARVYNERFQERLARAKAKNIQFSLNSKDGIDSEGNPVQSLKAWATDILAASRSGDILQYRTLPDGRKVAVKPPAGKTTNKKIIPTADILQLAAEIKNAPDVLTVDALEKLGKRAEKIYTDYVEPGDKSDSSVETLDAQVKSFNKSLHGAFTDSFDADPNSKSFPVIGHDILELDKQYAKDRAVFANATGAILKKSSTSIPPDVLGDTFFKSIDNPSSMDDLRKIVGDKVMNDGAATFIQNIVSTATSDFGTPKQSFDVNKFAAAVGADNPSSNRYQAVSKALQTSGVKIEDLVQFIKSARLAGQGAPPGIATMLARKMTFGGFGSILKTVLPLGAAEVGHGIFGSHVGGLGTAGGILIGWKAADIMTNPNYLRDATTFMDPSKGEAERRMAMWRVAKAVLPSDSWQINPPSDNKGTGKTPPKTIEDRARQATDAYFQGSEFLNRALTQPGSLAQ